MRCSHVQAELAALSLGALEESERDVVLNHVARCRDCADELRSYRETAARLGLALQAQEPPSALKSRLVAAATAQETAGQASRPWAMRPWFRLALRQPATLVACLALLVALSTMLWAARLQTQLDQERAATASLRDRAARYDRVVAVLQASELRLSPMQGADSAPGAVGRLYLDSDTGAGMMMARSLPPLAEGRTYQLWWVAADGKRESGGLIPYTDPQGNAYALVQCPGQCGSWQSVGVTEEPAGGSPAPTGQRVLAGTL